jgi:hypothetical protein
LKLEGVNSAATLWIVDVNNGPPAGAARILDQPHVAPAADFDEAEVCRLVRQRSVALESAPVCRLC